MVRDGVVVADPDDENVLHGDQNPAHENQPFDLGITPLATRNVDGFDEGAPFDFWWRRTSTDELKEVREHVAPPT